MRIEATSAPNGAKWNGLATLVGGGYFQTAAEPSYLAVVSHSEPLFLTATDHSGQVLAIVTGTTWRPRVWPMSHYCGQVTLLSVPAVRANADVDPAAIVPLCERYLSAAGAFSLRIVSYDSPGSDAVLGPLGYQLGERWEFIVNLSNPKSDIWGTFACERRTDVRKAEKMGVETRRDNTHDALDLLVAFEHESRRRRGQTPVADQRTALAGRDRLASGMADVFVTYHEGQPVNAAMFTFFNGRAYYHMSGTSEAGQRCRGPVHLIWTALNYYREQDARYVNLGAALPGQEGLYRFKRDFGAQVVRAPIGRKKISAVGSALDRVRSWLGR